MTRASKFLHLVLIEYGKAEKKQKASEKYAEVQVFDRILECGSVRI